MARFSVGDRVAAPVCVTVPERKPARSRYSYDIGEVIATGRNKKNGKPAVKVRFTTVDTIWARRITNDPYLVKWCFAKDCDRV